MDRTLPATHTTNQTVHILSRKSIGSIVKGYDAAKVDIWSCGVILFVLMAGYLPFHDQNVMAIYRKIYKGEFRCPRWFSPELTIAAEIFELTPKLVVVEVKKKAGDRDEYEEFCRRELKPALINLTGDEAPSPHVASDTD